MSVKLQQQIKRALHLLPLLAFIGSCRPLGEAQLASDETTYTGNITLSLQAENAANDDFWVLVSAPTEAVEAAICHGIKSIQQCNPQENVTSGTKRYFPLGNRVVKNGRAFFKAAGKEAHSAYLNEGLLLTIAYFVPKAGSTDLVVPKDFRHVRFSKSRNGAGATTNTGTGTSTGGLGGASAVSESEVTAVARQYCSGTKCHSVGKYDNYAGLKKNQAAVRSQIDSGYMPPSGMPPDQKAILLRALQ